MGVQHSCPDLLLVRGSRTKVCVNIKLVILNPRSAKAPPSPVVWLYQHGFRKTCSISMGTLAGYVEKMRP